jgi:hypothetical protein
MAKQKRVLVFFLQNNDFDKSIKFFKKGFKHCGVLYHDTTCNHWIIVEYIYGQMLIEVLDSKKTDAFFELLKQKKAKVLKGDCAFNHTKFPTIMKSWIKEHSCVSYVQRILGLNKWWIFTPYQLYCALKKHNFCEIEL